MKKIFKSLCIISGFLFIQALPVSAQQANSKEIFVVIDNGSDKAFSDKSRKTLDCYVVGLKDANEIAELKTRILEHGGVTSCTINEPINGKCATHLNFDRGFQVNYFKKLLFTMGVKKIVINGKTKNVEDLGKS